MAAVGEGDTDAGGCEPRLRRVRSMGMALTKRFEHGDETFEDLCKPMKDDESVKPISEDTLSKEK